MLNRSGEAALSAVLKSHQLHASITDDATYCGQWYDREPANGRASFHLISSGVCWVQSTSLEQPLALGAGDLILFPRGAAHDLCNPPAEIVRAIAPAGDGYTTMLCGELDFASGTRNPVLSALPECLVVPARESGPEFSQLAQLLCLESRARAFGSNIVLDKLADALFVMAVRHYINHATDPRGLLAALLDGRLARALDAMHSYPGTDWSVSSLAQTAGMSRTAFALRFCAVLGATPHQYLTELRMAEALRLMRDPRLSVTAIAEQLGYQSEAAFRRGFKRVHGHGPGHFRRATTPETALADAT